MLGLFITHGLGLVLLLGRLLVLLHLLRNKLVEEKFGLELFFHDFGLNFHDFDHFDVIKIRSKKISIEETFDHFDVIKIRSTQKLVLS